jgi:hypothetical protein
MTVHWHPFVHSGANSGSPAGDDQVWRAQLPGLCCNLKRQMLVMVSMVSDEDSAKISAMLLGDNSDRAAAMPVDDIPFVSPAAASGPGPGPA